MRDGLLVAVALGGLAGGTLGFPRAAAAQSSGWSPGVAVTVNTALGRRDSNWGPGATLDLLRRTGRFAFGVEAGYQAFGTEVTRIENFDNRAGWVYREDFRRSMLRLVAIGRIGLRTGPARPYLVAGLGGYDGRFRNRIEVRDENGQRVPFYDFEGSGSDVKPGATAGLGLALVRARGGPRLALEGRWHGIFDVTEDGFGTADFLSFGVAIRW